MFSLLLMLAQPADLPPCDQEAADNGVQLAMNMCAQRDFLARHAHRPRESRAWRRARRGLCEHHPPASQLDSVRARLYRDRSRRVKEHLPLPHLQRTNGNRQTQTRKTSCQNHLW